MVSHEEVSAFAARHRIVLTAAEEILRLYAGNERKCRNAVMRLKTGREIRTDERGKSRIAPTALRW